MFKGELGDWGVCANQKSPRAGLLTFEHQGCPEFEPHGGAENAVTESASSDVEETHPAPRSAEPIKIDLEELIMAFEDHDMLGLGKSNYLDTFTGEVLMVCDDFDEDDANERIEANTENRYRSIDHIDAHESFRIMEDFAASFFHGAVKSRLINALSQSKPFRRFKDIVHSEIGLREKWFAFHEDAMAEYASGWLEAEGVKAELLRRRRGRN